MASFEKRMKKVFPNGQHNVPRPLRAEWSGGPSITVALNKVDWVLSIQSGSLVESGLQEKLHFCDLISKAIHLKLAKMLWDNMFRA